LVKGDDGGLVMDDGSSLCNSGKGRSTAADRVLPGDNGDGNGVEGGGSAVLGEMAEENEAEREESSDDDELQVGNADDEFEAGSDGPSLLWLPPAPDTRSSSSESDV
jgi:hypothetical protein